MSGENPSLITISYGFKKLELPYTPGMTVGQLWEQTAADLGGSASDGVSIRRVEGSNGPLVTRANPVIPGASYSVIVTHHDKGGAV